MAAAAAAVLAAIPTWMAVSQDNDEAPDPPDSPVAAAGTTSSPMPMPRPPEFPFRPRPSGDPDRHQAPPSPAPSGPQRKLLIVDKGGTYPRAGRVQVDIGVVTQPSRTYLLTRSDRSSTWEVHPECTVNVDSADLRDCYFEAAKLMPDAARYQAVALAVNSDGASYLEGLRSPAPPIDPTLETIVNRLQERGYLFDWSTPVSLSVGGRS